MVNVSNGPMASKKKEDSGSDYTMVEWTVLAPLFCLFISDSDLQPSSSLLSSFTSFLHLVLFLLYTSFFRSFLSPFTFSHSTRRSILKGSQTLFITFA